jgi:hypothetical protein
MSRSLTALALVVALCTTAVVARAQAYSSSADTPSIAQSFVAPDQASSGAAAKGTNAQKPSTKAFSAIGFAADVSPLGIGGQVATNLNSHINIRAEGSYFTYTVSNITSNGFTISPKLNLASAGAAVDLYPFHAGFRISPGVLFYNQNSANATYVVAPGTSFKLNNVTYYSGSGSNAVQGTGVVGLGNGTPAFTITTGWGNIAKTKGHWSFPVEVGIALIQAPTLNITLSGEGCNDPQGTYCVNVATDPTIQSNLKAQIATYQNDLNPLKTYPIVSFGVSYSFHTR